MHRQRVDVLPSCVMASTFMIRLKVLVMGVLKLKGAFSPYYETLRKRAPEHSLF